MPLAAIYEAHFHVVCVWLRALGCHDRDLEDQAQEVFLVVERKLAGFDGQNVIGWLHAITRRVAAGYRRRAWYQHVFGFGGRDELPDTAPSAADVVEHGQRRRVVMSLLEGMTVRRREVFVLFELEGWSGEQIAALLDIPLKTVWTRLHHARRDFLERLAELESRTLDPALRAQAKRAATESWRQLIDGETGGMR